MISKPAGGGCVLLEVKEQAAWGGGHGQLCLCRCWGGLRTEPPRRTRLCTKGRQVGQLHSLKHTPQGAGREGGHSLCSQEELGSPEEPLSRGDSPAKRPRSHHRADKQRAPSRAALTLPNTSPRSQCWTPSPCGKGCRQQPMQSRAQMPICTDKKHLGVF